MSIQKNFVINNGLEVGQKLIYANVSTNKVGILTNTPNYSLHVNGGIGVTNLYVSGISTVNNIILRGSVSTGSSTGSSGQYLISTGTGVTWSALPNTRSVLTVTATSGQSVFNVSYIVNFIDVYINGIRLTQSEYTAINGYSITLDTACFGGESIDFITYSSSNSNGDPSYWTPTSSGIHTLSNVGIGTTNAISKLTVNGPILATEGFISIGNTTPITITLIDNQLIFNAVGIGSTTLTLYP